jgi:hypothetical protein
MLTKPIAVLLLGFVLGYAEQSSGAPALPDGLSEAEKQTILKERGPKPHVEAALKVSEARVANALKLAQESQYKAAALELDVFSSLVIYADAYARKTLGHKTKDRNHCLKRIEQTIFKQTRNLDAVMRDLPLEAREVIEPQISEVKKVRLRAINDLVGSGQVINSSNEK